MVNWVDAVFSKSQRYHLGGESICDQNLCVRFSMPRGDVTMKKLIAVENSKDLWT